jgi:CheY-like chemotaxis protein/HPt (histidine-containing phosphotransfer) domain-containing protein
VLLDADIAGLDVEELVTTVKVIPKLSATAFMMLVPLGRQVDVPLLQRIGVSDYVTKPLMPSELFDTLVKVISTRGGGELLLKHKSESATVSSFPKTKLAGARILVAEDNEINQYVATQMLLKAGYQCDVVANGKQAVEALRKTSYDAVLMDCQMPEIDGFEATRIIRRDEQAGNLARPGTIPIIALTANAMKSDPQKCMEAGMTDYLSKPLNPIELVDRIDTWLKELVSPSLAAPEAFVKELPDPVSPKPPASAPANEVTRPTMDVVSLLRRCGGDPEIAKELIDMFHKRVPEDVKLMEAYVDAGDAEKTASLAHSLKGVAANLSAETLRGIALRLETAGHAADLEAARIGLGQLQEEWKRLDAGLPAVLEQIDSGVA